MFTTENRMRLLGRLWLAVVAVSVICSMAVGARLSISALLLVLGIAPVALALLRAANGAHAVSSRA